MLVLHDHSREKLALCFEHCLIQTIGKWAGGE